MKRKKCILWMSRHKAQAGQIAALRQLYGLDVVIEQIADSFGDAREIARRYREAGYDDMVVVAPLSVFAVLCQEGIRPLWSESVEENDPRQIDFRGARGQGFRFVRFRRVKRIAMEFEDDLQPAGKAGEEKK